MGLKRPSGSEGRAGDSAEDCARRSFQRPAIRTPAALRDSMVAFSPLTVMVMFCRAEGSTPVKTDMGSDKRCGAR